MTQSLVDLFAQKFIARRDVKAIQHADGSYAPTREYPDPRNREVFTNVGWKRSDIEAHLAGERTYGHYLLDTDDTVKLFCIDADLRTKGSLPREYFPDGVPDHAALDEQAEDYEYADVRAVWADRRDPRRKWLKYCMRFTAHHLCNTIFTQLEIPCAAAYSGSKGFHVYGFTGRVPAADAREGALIVMEDLGMELERGDSLFKVPEIFELGNPFANFSYEVYPKQSSLAGKDLGNLLRLPLGRNQKSKDPTFFMDMTSALNELNPVDPIFALTTDNPWKRPGE